MLRDYQERGIAAVREHWGRGDRRVLAVAPTGAGKGTMAAHVAAQAARDGLQAVFVVHRGMIARDIAQRIRGLGVEAAEYTGRVAARPGVAVQVCTVQAMMHRQFAPPGDVVVFDEAHHYAADTWARALDVYKRAMIVGFTATPQRADGRALSGFDALFTVATYAEMLDRGIIVPCRVLRPERPLGIDLAQDPVRAYQDYTPGSRAFLFARTVEDAQRFASEFRRAGVPADSVTHATGERARDRVKRRVEMGRVLVVTSVYTMTEGVDIPSASTVVLARAPRHVSTYMQMVGRVLRAHGGKSEAVLLDLCGASWAHGSPTQDREYSLGGKGISMPGERAEEATEPSDAKPQMVVGEELTEATTGAPAVPVPRPEVCMPDFSLWPKIVNPLEGMEL